MTESYVDPKLLILGGPDRFTRQAERLLGQLGYTDVANIDGAGDKGGDLLATIAGTQWVFQCKWQRRGSVPQAGVNEVSEAMDYYHAERGVVITNLVPSHDADSRRQALARIGQHIDFWTGTDLMQLWDQNPDRGTRIRLRD